MPCKSDVAAWMHHRRPQHRASAAKSAHHSVDARGESQRGGECRKSVNADGSVTAVKRVAEQRRWKAVAGFLALDPFWIPL